MDEDVREFVAARWPDLESVAHVVTLDPEVARRVTSEVLVGLARHWSEALEDGRPAERSRRDLLAAALGSASHRRPAPAREPTTDQPSVPSAVPWEEPAGDDPVVLALVAALHAADPLERAVLAAQEVWDAGPDEVAHLLDRPAGPVHEAATGLRRRLGSAHDAARAAAGLDPARWALDHDTRDAVGHLLRDLDEPPDPAALVAGVAGRLRRRSLVLGGTAAAGLAAGAWAVGSTVVPDAPASPADRPVPPAGDPSWASTRTWVARGPLATDPAVRALVEARDPGASLLWAGDAEDLRVVVARRDLSREGSTTLRVWSGTRGAPVAALSEVPLRVEEIEDADDAVALSLPSTSGTHGLLLLLSRPQVLNCAYSPLVTYTRAGGVRRQWREAGLIDGVAAVGLRRPPGPALRVRLGPFDGPPAGPQRVTLGTTRAAETDPSTALVGAIAPFVAATCGRAADTITSEIVLEAQVPGDVLAPWVVVAKPGTGEVVVVHTRLDDGSLLRTVRVRDDGRARVGSADLETARPLSVDDGRKPFAVRLPPMRAEIGRFLVVAPGAAASAQLLAVTSSAYPVSEVVPVSGGTAVLEVVNARQASVYRLVLWDADGRKLGSWRQLFGRRDPNDMWPRFG